MKRTYQYYEGMESKKASFKSNLLFLLLIGMLCSPVAYLLWNQYGQTTTLLIDEVSRPVQQTLKLHAPQLDWLSTRGRWIINAAGEPVILRGVNVSSINWGTDAWNDQAVEYAITHWKATVIRTRVFQDEYQADPEAFFAKMEAQIIRPARKQGVYVILHPWIHDNQPMPDTGTIEMWRAIAKKYKDDPTILYDLLAEPRDVPQEELTQAYIDLIEAVRQEHPRALVMVSGLGWGREINSWLESPLPYDKIVYRSNPYNQPGEFQGLFGDIALTYPVFLGEFGADGYPPMSVSDVQALINFADDLGLGWTAWNFSAQGCPCLLSEENRFLPSQYGEIVQKALMEGISEQPLSSNVPQVTPDVTEDYLIYTDALHHGFENYSWGMGINLQSTQKTLKGEHSLEANRTSDSYGIFLSSSKQIDLASFQTIDFWIATDDPDIVSHLVIYFKNKAGSLSNQVSLKEYIIEIQDQWQHVSVPLNLFNFDTTQISGIFITPTENILINKVFIDSLLLKK